MNKWNSKDIKCEISNKFFDDDLNASFRGTHFTSPVCVRRTGRNDGLACRDLHRI